MREQDIQRQRVLPSKGGYQGGPLPPDFPPPPRTPSGTADPVPKPRAQRRKRRAA